MKFAKMASALSLGLLSTLSAGIAGAQSGPVAGDGWIQVADGVYERTDGDVRYRQAMGRAGAIADLQMLQGELTQRQRAGFTNAQYMQNLRNAISAITEYVASDPGGPEPMNAYAWSDTAAVFCGFAGHLSADAWHLSNPGGGPGGATSSATYTNLIANSGIPTAYFYVSASTTPNGGSPTSVNGNSSISYTSSPGSAALLTRTTGPVGAAFNNSFTTYSTMSVTGCAGGFRSFQEVGVAM